MSNHRYLDYEINKPMMIFIIKTKQTYFVLWLKVLNSFIVIFKSIPTNFKDYLCFALYTLCFFNRKFWTNPSLAVSDCSGLSVKLNFGTQSNIMNCLFLKNIWSIWDSQNWPWNMFEVSLRLTIILQIIKVL